MRYFLFSFLVFIYTNFAQSKANSPEQTKTELTLLLTDFLAHSDQIKYHESFWADDLVYTSSSSKVMNKSDILNSFKEKQSESTEPSSVFSGEDILIRLYDNMAALTFRLVEHKPDGKFQYYRNSGAFLLRNGKWQVVTWQATKVPEK